MKINKIRLILYCSVSLNLLFLSPYIFKYFESDKTPYFAITDDDNEIIKSVVKASINLEGSKMIQQDNRGGRLPCFSDQLKVLN